MTHEQYNAAFDAMKRLQVKGFRINLKLGPAQAMMLIGQLQLAARHPANIGPSSGLVRLLATELADELVEAEPELQAIIEAGWDPQHDVELTENGQCIMRKGREALRENKS